jgi:hypothetical protein
MQSLCVRTHAGLGLPETPTRTHFTVGPWLARGLLRSGSTNSPSELPPGADFLSIVLDLSIV